MKQFTVNIADKKVCVNAIFDSTEQYCKEYLFEGISDFSVTIESQDIDYERKAF